MTRFLKVAAVAAAVVLVATSAAQAQRQGRGGGGGFGGFGRGGGGGGMDAVALLRIEKVQAALGLGLEQGEQIQQIQDETRQAQREMFQGLQDLSQEERRERFGEMREKVEQLTGEAREKINGVLSADQSKRLDEIALQVRGPAALADDAVAEKLGVSEDQKEKMAAIREEGREAQREIFQSLRDGGGDRDAAREKMQAFQAAQTEKLMAVLTDAQREQFTAMQGEKLELTPEDMRGAFGGFGGGQGGGRGRRGQQQDNQ